MKFQRTPLHLVSGVNLPWLTLKGYSLLRDGERECLCGIHPVGDAGLEGFERVQVLWTGSEVTLPRAGGVVPGVDGVDLLLVAGEGLANRGDRRRAADEVPASDEVLGNGVAEVHVDGEMNLAFAGRNRIRERVCPGDGRRETELERAGYRSQDAVVPDEPGVAGDAGADIAQNLGVTLEPAVIPGLGPTLERLRLAGLKDAREAKVAPVAVQLRCVEGVAFEAHGVGAVVA